MLVFQETIYYFPKLESYILVFVKGSTLAGFCAAGAVRQPGLAL